MAIKKRPQISTILLSLILLIVILLVVTFFMGLFYINHTKSQFTGEYWIVGFRNSSKPPYKFWDCQYSNSDSFFNCGPGRIENSGTLEGAPKPAQGSPYISFAGKVISVDLSAMPVDGDGLFQIEAEDGTGYMVHLTSGESRCDREAIKIPDVDKGSKVEVQGEYTNGYLRICKPGTYIRNQ